MTQKIISNKDLQKSMLTWDQIKANYQKKLHHKSYLKLLKQQKQQITDQYIVLIKSIIKTIDYPINIRHFQALLNHLNWYDADIGAKHLVFQAISIVNYGKSTKVLKQLAHNDLLGQKHNQDLNAIKNYVIEHHNAHGYAYQFLVDPIVLDYLWNYPDIKRLLAIWIKSYVKIKRNYGLEAPTPKLQSLTYINQYVQLLLGIRMANQTIKLPRYKRYPTKILTKEQWYQQISSYGDYLSNMWD